MDNDGERGRGPGGTPRKRRRSSGASGGGGEILSLDSVREVHIQADRREVSLKGFVLSTDGELEVRGRGGKSGAGKEVGGFVLADQSCLVQVTLWGEVAKKFFPKIQEWLDAAPEPKFPYVEVAVAQVSRFRGPCSKELRRLQSTARTELKLLGSETVEVTPATSVLTENAAELMQAPLVSCFQGTVTRVESLSHTLEDIPMKEIGITMKNGFEVPVMLYGVQTEEEVKQHDVVAVWFGEHRAALPGREGSKGMVWLYASGYLLHLGPGEVVAKGRPLNIAGALMEAEEEENM